MERLDLLNITANKDSMHLSLLLPIKHQLLQLLKKMPERKKREHQRNKRNDFIAFWSYLQIL
jgi:hypothetical protein